MVPRRPLTALAAFVVAGLACSSGTDYGSGGGGTPVADVLVVPSASTKGAQAFNPNPYSLALVSGLATVKWGNNDGTQHRIVADGMTPLFDSGPLDRSETYIFTFTAAGSYPYHCSIHPGMIGTIQVNP